MAELYDEQEGWIMAEKASVRPDDPTQSRQPLEEAQGNDASVADACLSDRYADRDTLGFTPYVEAIARFLINPDTKPPLTLSVEGIWGGGKTSFMRQLQGRLQAEGRTTVWFDPWRHEKDEALWAAFALESIRQVSEQRSYWRRKWLNLNLRLRRFDWEAGWPDVVRRALVGLWVVALTVGLWVLLRSLPLWVDRLQALNPESPGWQMLKNVDHVLVWALGYGGILGALKWLLGQARAVFGNPLEADLKQYVSDPGYEGHVAFLERFHADFARIVETYAGRDPLYIFLDDLDRCDPDQATELMRALHLMMTDDPRVIFIIGMDRAKVAAGFARKHKEIVPYLTGSAEPRAALEYGYEFLEKFIQLPFQIPKPGERELRRFLAATRGEGAPEGVAPESRMVEEETFSITVAPDSDEIHDVVLMVAPALDYNPRRIKQFINQLRLRAYLANQTGLFAPDETESPFQQPLTLEQLGKFVAATLRWPMLLEDLAIYPQLLAVLYDEALGVTLEPDEAKRRKGVPADLVARWAARPALLELLRAGAGQGGALGRGAMRHVNVPALLRTAPPVLLRSISFTPEDGEGATQDVKQAK